MIDCSARHIEKYEVYVLTFLRTLLFFKHVLKQKKPTITVETQTFKLDDALSIEVDIYHENRSYAGTIMFIHGMNKHGKNDERVKFFCSCLAAIGYRVLVPNYPLICQHNFSLKSIDEMMQTIIVLTDDKQLCPTGKMALFSVSLSGTLAIKAAGREQAYQRISAYFTIGSGFYARDVFRMGMTQATIDSYMRMICIKHVLRHDKKLNKDVINAMDVLINDVFEPDEPAKLPDILPTLQPDSRILIEKIIDPNGNTNFLYERYKDSLKKLETDLFNSGRNDLLQFPIFLIHSANDNVFPPEESVKFSNYLTEHGVKHELFITTLMEHVSHDLSWRKFREIFTMFRFFYRYFDSV